MIFNSLEFLIFLPIVFLLYWFVFNKSLSIQNLLVLISSYIFYGWWDYRFLSLIVLSTVVDYFVGIKIQKGENRKIYLWISIIFNLGILCIFKYFNFFIDSWIDFLSLLGYQIQSISTLNIILPVGISFYTFQTMSYSLDIYNNKIKPTKNFIAFASFVAFFPQLVAGPIERASHLLPQMLNKRIANFELFKSGFHQIIVGFFKKVVVADNIAIIVDKFYDNPFLYSENSLFTIIIIIFYGFQIYCDFSGYSDIAIGISKLFGFNLNRNFKRPYFSSSFSNFWKRWHISLSSFLRDYLYIGLGGNRGSNLSTMKNLMVTMLLGGLWHGASLNFVFWGFLHGGYLAIERVINPAKSILYSLQVYVLVNLAWIPFRAQSYEDVLIVFKSLFNFSFSLDFPLRLLLIAKAIFVILIILFYDYLIEGKKIKNCFTTSLVFFILIILLGNYKYNNFIYFQF
tara:strand:+ start:25070 stop:26437 length:1368 start_codon:yes stop_codon:yes gene_type:complete